MSTAIAQTFEEAFGLRLVTFYELRILQVLLEPVWYDNSESILNLRSISARLKKKCKARRGQPKRGFSPRHIRRCLQHLEERVGALIRSPRFQTGACNRRQTSNFYDVRAFAESLERRVLQERERRAKARKAAKAKASSRSMSSHTSAPMSAQETTDLEIRDHESQQHQDRNPDTNLISPVVGDTQEEGGLGTADTPEELARLVIAWKLGGDLLRRFQGQLGAAVRYVRHRIELAADYPQHVLDVPNPGGYVRRLLETDADLTLTVPPAVRKLQRRRAMFHPRSPVTETTDMPAEKLVTTLGKVVERLKSSELGKQEPGLVDEVAAKVEELARALPDPVPMAAVEPLEKALEELDARLGQALFERFPDDLEQARRVAEEQMEPYRRDMKPWAYEETVTRKTEKQLRKEYQVPALGQFFLELDL